MMIAFLVFKQINVLKIAVDVGFVVGITAATRPTGSAIFFNSVRLVFFDHAACLIVFVLIVNVLLLRNGF